MEQELNQDEVIVRYLLGDLSEPERDRLINKYLGDDEFFNRVMALEEELIDDYVRGELSGPEREQFERTLLATPQQRLRVKHAKAFSKALSSEKHALRWQSLSNFFHFQNLVPRYLMAAAALLFLVGGIWFGVETIRLRNRMGQESAALQQRERDLLALADTRRVNSEQLDRELKDTREQLRDAASEAAELQRRLQERERNRVRAPREGLTPTPPQRDNLVSLALTSDPAGERGPAKTLVILQGADLVRLQVNMAREEYGSYQAVLRSRAGDEVFTQSGLKPQSTRSGKAVVISFSTGLVANGDYVLSLSGQTGAGTYAEVERWSIEVIRR